MTTYGIRADGIFVMRKNDGTMRRLSVRAERKAGRWQYRDAETNRLYASGMEPGEFITRFWHANPASYDPELGFAPEAEAL